MTETYFKLTTVKKENILAHEPVKSRFSWIWLQYVSSGNCLQFWTLLSLSCLHSQRAFFTSCNVLLQLILTALEPQQKGSTLFPIVSVKVWAKSHWHGLGHMPILWTNVCDSVWGALGHVPTLDLGAGSALQTTEEYRRDSSPKKNWVVASRRRSWCWASKNNRHPLFSKILQNCELSPL